MAVATYEDVAVALGRPISDSAEQGQVTYWLNAAEMLIASRLGDATLLDQEKLVYVEVESVLARMQNPESYQSETIDDYTYRFGTETRRVTILDEWWNLLSPIEGAGVFSTRPGFEPDAARWPVSTPPIADHEWFRW